MKKKTNKQLKSEKVLRQRVIAKTILLSPDFEKAIKKKDHSALGELLKKHGIDIPLDIFSFDEIRELFKYLSESEEEYDLLHADVFGQLVKVRRVRPIKKERKTIGKTGYEIITDNGIIDENSYIHLVVKADGVIPRKTILHLISQELDAYIPEPVIKKNKLKRNRDIEIMRALKVWELRRLRKTFKVVAREMGIPEAAAKKLFYRAYELLYGRKFQPEAYEKPEVKKEYLKKECSTCPEKQKGCNTLCPDVIQFVEQDEMSYQRDNTYGDMAEQWTEEDKIV